MATYIVAYDLHKHGQDYAGIINKLKSYGTYWHCQGSVWLIVSSKSAEQVRDDLLTALDGNDKLVVIKLDREAAWKGYNKEISDWLQKNL